MQAAQMAQAAQQAQVSSLLKLSHSYFWYSGSRLMWSLWDQDKLITFYTHTGIIHINAIKNILLVVNTVQIDHIN
jgi:hypothetical protein